MSFLILMALTKFVLATEILHPGQKKFLPAQGSVWVENGKIIEVRDLGQRFEVRAKSSGSSEIKLGDKSYRFLVLSMAQSQTHRLLSQSIPKTLGLSLTVEGNDVVIAGRLVRWSDWNILREACLGNNCRYLFKASLNLDLYSQIEKSIADLLKESSLPNVKVERSHIFAVNLPSNSPMLPKLEEFFNALGIQIRKTEGAIEVAPLVKVQITVAEVKRQMLLKYGIQPPTSYQAQVLPNFIGKESLASVNFLEQSGIARVLASPNILCRSGREAEFLAGGEFPIKILNYKVQDVVWKKYGILLRIKPLADFSGRMSVGLETEISSLDPSTTVDGIPGMFTNRIQSHFDLVEPKTIALSGLIKSGIGKSTEGLPLLSRIPILGSLFSSRDFQENRTELVIFVRPEVVDLKNTSDTIELPRDL